MDMVTKKSNCRHRQRGQLCVFARLTDDGNTGV
ncbi:hypothetical protein Oter_0360 [Opitutus terrae PB90-1]|uniref:Uncharacterized protein n=1 Tax=Opitutus terrae (strain DSM 11246 / JCM 15787 / PB90-1) TaxID=452637 RepID=B1ZQY3_OPITP|nr:hypothetical protein Oter_0360 [Opitutus terrae PB90-1]